MRERELCRVGNDRPPWFVLAQAKQIEDARAFHGESSAGLHAAESDWNREKGDSSSWLVVRVVTERTEIMQPDSPIGNRRAAPFAECRHRGPECKE